MMDAIRTENLTKHFARRTAVDQLNLTVQRGEVFGFLGPNGAGKTTTIAMLLGLVRPSAGRAFLFDQDVWQNPSAALRSVGAMIEAPAFYPYLSGRDNLRALAIASNIDEAQVTRALVAVGLSERARDRFKTYSLGMRQRLAIAAALLGEPQLIILDEPTNGLDPAGQHEIRELLRSLAQNGTTVFLSSHMLHEVEAVCDRVAILKEGRLVVQGRVAELLNRGQRLLLRVTSSVEQAATLLRAQPWVTAVEQHEQQLLISTAPERAADISLLLAQQQIAVLELRQAEDDLETLFFELTQATT